MSNFALRPINEKIIYKLLQKQKAFSRQSTTSAGSPVDDYGLVQFFNRSTWAHLISLNVVSSKKDPTERIAIIGAGEFNEEQGGANKPLFMRSFEDIYRPTLEKEGANFYKPISGIKSISTRFEGTLRSRREATVEFTIFSLDDLDRLSPHFFRVGAEVLIEFGWHSKHSKGADNSYVFQGSLGNMIIDSYHQSGIDAIKEKPRAIKLLKENTSGAYEEEVLTYGGDYDYLLGQISDFEYSLRDDGGFDCTIKVVTVGMSLLDSKINRELSPTRSSFNTELPPDVAATEFYQVMEHLPEVLAYSVIENYNKNGNKLNKLNKLEVVDASDLPTSFSTIDVSPQAIDKYINLPTYDDFAKLITRYGFNYDGAPKDYMNKVTTQESRLDLNNIGMDPVSIDFKYTEYGPMGIDERWVYPIYEYEMLNQDKMVYPHPDYWEWAKYGGHGFVLPEGMAIHRDTNLYKAKDVYTAFSMQQTLDAARKINRELDLYIGKLSVMHHLHTSWFGEGYVKGGYKTSTVEDRIEVLKDLDINFMVGEILYDAFGPTYWREWQDVTEEEKEEYYNPTSDTAQDEVTISPPSEFIEQNSDPNGYAAFFGKDDGGDTLRGQQGTGFKTEYRARDGVAVTKKIPGVLGHDTKGITIFVTYAQGSTVQIFTGLNWEGDFKEFNEGIKSFPAGAFTDFEDTNFGTGAADNEFLEKVDDKNPPKTWVRWGWFEDNILTKYLGIISKDDILGKDIPISVFKSIERKFIGDVAAVATDVTGESEIKVYESNKITLPSGLNSTDVNQILIPDRVHTLGKVKEGISESGKFNFYGALGQFLDSNVGETIAPVEVVSDNKDTEDNLKVGYLRNVFIEVNELKNCFGNIGNLKEGIDNLIGLFKNNFGMVHNLEVQAGNSDPGVIGLQDKNLIINKDIWNVPQKNIRELLDGLGDEKSLKDISKLINVYEFPSWEKESIVKKQDLKVSIPNSMAITALFAGKENNLELGTYDKNKGSLQAQKLSKFLKLDETGDPLPNKSLGKVFNLLPYAQSTQLMLSGNGEFEYGMNVQQTSDIFYNFINASYKRAFSGKPVEALDYDAPVIELEVMEPEAPMDVNMYKTSRLGTDGTMYHTDGTLKTSGNSVIDYLKLQEYELEYDVNKSVHVNFSALNGLMDLSLTIDGTAGIFPGNSFISTYLPKAWQKRTSGAAIGQYPIIFQVVDVSHEVSPEGWSTDIKGMPRFNPEAFPYTLTDTEKSNLVNENSSQDSIPENTYGIANYRNFFNLNATATHHILTNVLRGINTSLLSSDEGYIIGDRSVGALKDIFFPGDRDEIGAKYQIRAHNLDQFGGYGYKYADFTDIWNEWQDKLTWDYHNPLIPEVPREYAGGNYGEVEQAIGYEGNKTIYIPGSDGVINTHMDAMIFLQMSIIIAGLSYYGSTPTGLTHRDRRLNEPWKRGAPYCWYNKMLADNNFKASKERPSSLTVNGISRVTKTEPDIKEAPFGSRLEYFKLNDFKEGVDPIWNLEAQHPQDVEIPVRIRFGDSYGVHTQAGGHQPGGSQMTIGPIRAGILGNLTLSTGRATDLDYKITIDYWTQVFLTIIRNEFGAKTWREFDNIIKNQFEDTDFTSMVEGDAERVGVVNTKNIFEYALKCRYLISNPT